MRAGILLLMFFVGVVSNVNAQPFQLQGTVVNAEDDKPLSGASVFINNGSKGTTTNQDGQFILTNVPYNTFELVVSFVSYETIVVNISPENIGKRFKIKMSPKQNELEEVIIGPSEKDGWNKWGKLFIESFIGTSVNAQKSVLQNPETLIFRHNKKTGVLTVSARDQLKIKNSGLGYTINYQLEKFEFNHRKSLVFYQGYAHFNDIKTTSKRRKQIWEKERKVAYDGSITHFMRAYYENKVTENGFEMRLLYRLTKKDTATRALYDQIMSRDYTNVDTSKFFIYFNRSSIISHPVINIISKSELPADSFRIKDTINNLTLMYCNATIQVKYKNELESKEYGILHMMPGAKGPQTSLLYFPNNTPIIVLENGMYFQPLDVLTEGYWAFEKIGELLPSDYGIR
jgi:hypothetical protein